MASKFAWTPEVIEFLKERFFAGDSQGQIAAAIGATRSMVGAKITRLFLVRNDAQMALWKERQKREQYAIRSAAQKKRSPKPRVRPPEPAKPTPPVPFLSRGADQCAAILDLPVDARGLPFVCGHATVPDKAWCPHHFDLYIDHERMKG